jgi:hypothetical protein
MKECVRRRVMKSVIANPHCSEAAARDAMEAVWDVCYNDTRPFDRAPWNNALALPIHLLLLRILYLNDFGDCIGLQSIMNWIFLFDKNTRFFQRLSFFFVEMQRYQKDFPFKMLQHIHGWVTHPWLIFFAVQIKKMELQVSFF